jgi:hypothetical protein
MTTPAGHPNPCRQTIMPNHYKVGDLRPSQIMFSFGVGSIVDLPNLSVMVMGLDEWDTTQSDPLAEERLLAAVREELGQQVQRLVPPPTPPEDTLGPTNPFEKNAKVGIPVSPFPGWGVCPACRLLAPLNSGVFEFKPDPYRADRTRYVHGNCQKARGNFAPIVVPARFLVACRQSHLDDFPWLYFVHRGASQCSGRLRLLEVGVSGSAADVVVRCDICNQSRSLSDAFGTLGSQNMPQCRGRNPHLRNFEDDGCEEQMKAILLGASNSWFPITLAVLSIPGTRDELGQLVEKHWAVLKEVSSTSELQLLRRIGQLKPFSQYSDNDLWAAIQKQTHPAAVEEADTRNLKLPEWQVFSAAGPALNTDSFRLNPVAPPKGYERYFTQAVLVERLREVRALVGFTRIESPGELSEAGTRADMPMASLSRTHQPKWVPATEIRGEGIFLQFKEEAIQTWLKTHPALLDYERRTHQAHTQWRRARNIDNPADNFPGLRYMLLHSFSHALMRQLAIECGYAAASLRERIYSSRPEDDVPMAGVLIYTAAPDSEGTLGGLVRLGQPDLMGRHMDQALEQMRLCASDPLCADHEPSTELHWAACHACLFSPETSCERGNKYLDRALLIPTVNAKADNFAFFQDVIPL